MTIHNKIICLIMIMFWWVLFPLLTFSANVIYPDVTGNPWKDYWKLIRNDWND